VKTRHNLLALAVLLGGAVQLALPGTAGATDLSPLDQPPESPPGPGDLYCCQNASGLRCCGTNGCLINQYGCFRILV
jgi:hypothetical protein